MSILKQPPINSVLPKVVALTPFNLYLERVKSVSDSLRAASQGLGYIPMQFGGLFGQRESLLVNSAIKLIDFKVTETE